MQSMNFLYRLLITTAIVMATLALMSRCAEAGEATLTWTAPTQNCNGSPLTDLNGYTLTYGQKRETLGTSPLTKTVTGLLPGTWWFSLAATTPTAKSEFITVEKVVAPNEFVTTSNKVYTFFRTGGNIVLTVTPHTVGIGVVCDATQSVNGKYRVPLEAVTWNGTRLTAALADCG